MKGINLPNDTAVLNEMEAAFKYCLSIKSTYQPNRLVK